MKNKCIPHTGDVSQAFCQSYLTENEIYICKTLYGLKRSPKHWYDTAKNILLKIGFKQSKTAPCIFVGHLIPDKPPDISIVISLLAKYCRNPSKGHIDAAIRVIKYPKGTKNLRIKFSSKDSNNLQSFTNFPIPNNKLTGLCDANWGPQDQSRPKEGNKPQELELFKTRSMSGFITWMNGPIMWMLKRQTFTTRNSAEAEIYATDESAKNISHLLHIIDGIGLTKTLVKGPITIWNDNRACVCWSKNTTTKGLRHVQIRENAVHEGVAMGLFNIKLILSLLCYGFIQLKQRKNSLRSPHSKMAF